MSQMIPFQQAQLPAFMQQAAADAAINQQAAAGIGGTSVDGISLKGGRFHVKRVGQDPVTLELFALDVIIVHANPGMTKALFENEWSEENTDAPVCSSDDGITPRTGSEKPQCNTCAACPQNQFGSKISKLSSKPTKACSDKKTIAVVTPGQEGGEMLRLQVPTMALNDYGSYMRGLPKQVPYYGIVTRISFDTTVSYPKIKFAAVDYLRDPQAFATVQQRHHSDEAKAIAGVAGFTPMAAAALPAPVAQPALSTPPAFMQPQATPQQIPVQQVPVQQPVYQQPVHTPVQAAATMHGQQYQQPVQPQYQQAPVQAPYQTQPQFQKPVSQPLSAAPAPVDPSVAAIFGGQAIGGAAAQQPPVQAAQVVQQPHAQQAQTNLLPSGREPGRPMPGKVRRTKAEIAEDAAMGIGQVAGEQSEEQAAEAAHPQQQAPVQQAPQGFGAPAQQAPQQPVYQQPANQPQVMQGGAVDAFAGWDD